MRELEAKVDVYASHEAQAGKHKFLRGTCIVTSHVTLRAKSL